MTDIEFNQCIKDIVNGNQDGLKTIYENYSGMIYHVILDMVTIREVAEDITSEFFIKIFRCAQTYHEGTGHRKWLMTIARNMTIDYIRSHKKEELVDEIPEYEVSHEDSIEQQTINKLTVEEVMKLLKPEEKEILNMKAVGGFSFKEIATMLNKPMGTVTWQYQNAIKKLRRCNL